MATTAGVGGVAAAASRSLQDTPTWALATVCFVFISLGILIEHVIHILYQWLKRHRKTALIEAVEKLKSVLMLLGFMSLILAVTQRPISKICIPNRVAYSMLPCRKTMTTNAYEHFQASFPIGRPPERDLASDSGGSSDHCGSKGMTSFISQDGINQLNTFIFVLAIMQVVYSVATMALGRAKMKRWKNWEKETQTVEYLAANDPNRFRYTRQTTFGRRHMNACTTTSIQLWIKCFFRQFFHSVAKIDYLTLRHGFVSAHLSTNNTFNFRKYIQRSLEDEFKVIVGISPFMWLLVVIFMLVDVHGWNAYLWVSFVPLIVVLIIGTKLEVIVARMALELRDKENVIKGAPLVQPHDNLFWFSRPRFILTLLHFTLFMNAFEIAFFVWVTIVFGIKSCYHEHVEIIATRGVVAVMVQVLCSYITLPLYALVTQMGSHYKSGILEEQTVHAIKKWHTGVREKRKKNPYSNSPTTWVDNSGKPNSPYEEALSHHRNPSLSVFASRAKAKTEMIVDEVVNERTETTVEMEIESQGVTEIRPF